MKLHVYAERWRFIRFCFGIYFVNGALRALRRFRLALCILFAVIALLQLVRRIL